jgi:hypothetical protein
MLRVRLRGSCVRVGAAPLRCNPSSRRLRQSWWTPPQVSTLPELIFHKWSRLTLIILRVMAVDYWTVLPCFMQVPVLNYELVYVRLMYICLYFLLKFLSISGLYLKRHICWCILCVLHFCGICRFTMAMMNFNYYPSRVFPAVIGIDRVVYRVFRYGEIWLSRVFFYKLIFLLNMFFYWYPFLLC